MDLLENTLIAIPSSGRSDNVFIHKDNIEWFKLGAKVFTWGDEISLYKEERDKSQPSAQIVPLCSDHKNIGTKREEIMAYAKALGYSKVIMVDDSISIYYREPYIDPKPLKEVRQYRDLAEQLSTLCSPSIPLVGIANTYFLAQSQKVIFSPKKSVSRLVCIYTDSYQEGVYSSVETFEDVAIQASFLDRGLLTIVLGTYALSKRNLTLKGGTWTKGREQQIKDRIRETKKLLSLYPNTVKAKFFASSTGKEPSCGFNTKLKAPSFKECKKIMEGNGYKGEYYGK